ncbi:hypothetical protein V0U79_01740 [Hyphobacterium sp. HN65]|uniref:Uncharacterized protein n=1 Tax=Hyphobacterium lacteum TaxID=3116575 RepID=A0ABU7LMC4_9PROT|nr:hypothetical protein [Hyphobacterium sp. HN65]MEE2525070.1 hypothetical protein [Hyphobacterium sp. HN65]
MELAPTFAQLLGGVAVLMALLYPVFLLMYGIGNTFFRGLIPDLAWPIWLGFVSLLPLLGAGYATYAISLSEVSDSAILVGVIVGPIALLFGANLFLLKWIDFDNLSGIKFALVTTSSIWLIMFSVVYFFVSVGILRDEFGISI